MKAATAILAVFVLSAGTAQACIMKAKRDLMEIRYADFIVSGTLTDYSLKDQDKGIRGYAVLTIKVSSMIKGFTHSKVTAIWDNSTFPESAEGLKEGSYVFGLREATSPMPPLRGPSATNIAPPDPNMLMVVQAPCAAPQMYPDEGLNSVLIRLIMPFRLHHPWRWF